MTFRTVRNVGGTLQELRRLVRNVAGTLQDGQRVVRNVGGTLRDIFVASELITPPTWPDSFGHFVLEFAPTDAIALASLTILRDGTWSAVGTATQTGDWHRNKTSTIGDGYEIRFTLVSGDTLYTNGASTWTALTANRTVQQRSVVTANSGNAEASSTVLVEIRKASYTADLVSKNCILNTNAAVEP